MGLLMLALFAGTAAGARVGLGAPHALARIAHWPAATLSMGAAPAAKGARRAAASTAAAAPKAAKAKKAAAAAEAEAPAHKGSSLFIVESPSKAKTLSQYLGADFTVLATKGHVRVLPTRKGSVAPDDGFAMTFEVPPRQAEHVGRIVREAQKASSVYLAMDPDREGEAIAWHLLKELERAGVALSPCARDSLGADGAGDVAREPAGAEAAGARVKRSAAPKLRKAAADAAAAADGVAVWRVSFNSVSKAAVLDALAAPRAIDLDLVAAQQARQALDYLVGFTLSPVLWKRMPAARSAGRVQSVALRLIAEREVTIERFVPTKFWRVTAELARASGAPAARLPFAARLSEVGGLRLDKLSLRSEADASALAEAARRANWTVAAARASRSKRQPRPPYNTASLQQDASARLLMSVARAMSVAQTLYEGVAVDGGAQVGLITYMRTDAVNISDAALADVRAAIGREYGAAALSPSARTHASRSKNAQEAHEAIRPVEMGLLPWSKQLTAALDDEQLRLYDLIWRRTAASQMADAVFDSTAVTLLGTLADAADAPAAARAADDGRAAPAEAEAAEAAGNVDAAWAAGESGGARVAVAELAARGKIGTVKARASGRTLVSSGHLDAYPPPAYARAADADAAAPSEDAAAAAATADGAAAAADADGGDDDEGGGGEAAGDTTLPPLAEADALVMLGARASAHTTKPAARFSEATLVSQLETLGIGRPSTYAPTMAVLRARDYARLAAGRLVPTLTGRFVDAFLRAHFERYVQYDFTAAVEAELDAVSAGRLSRSTLLERFWQPLSLSADAIGSLPATETWAALDAELGHLAFAQDAHALEAGSIGARAVAEGGTGSCLHPRGCPSCGAGRLSIKHSRFGPFVGCSAHPDCTYTLPLPQSAFASASEGGALGGEDLPKVLGADEAGREISVRLGPFGLYVQATSADDAALREQPAPAASAAAGRGRGAAAAAAAAEGEAEGEAERQRLLAAESSALDSLTMAQLRAELAQLKNARRAANGAPTTPTPRRKAELVAAVRELKGLPPPAPPPPPPERRRLPNALSAYNVTLESATRLFSLPRKLGAHPELGGEMVAKLGPKSGYVEHNKSYFWLAEPDDAYTVTTAQAAAIVTELGERRAQRPQRRGRVIVARGGRGATSAAAKAPATPATPAAPVPEADPAPVAAPRSRAKAKAPAAQARAGAASPTAAKRAASPAKPAASKVKGSKSRATATPPP